MTPTSKPVTRVTILPHRGRALVCTLGPGDVLYLRQKGRRQSEGIDLTWRSSAGSCANVGKKRKPRNGGKTVDKPAIAYTMSPFAMLAHSALHGVTGWGGRRRVWAAFAVTGEMLTWSSNKRAVASQAERIGRAYILARISGIERC